MHDRAIVIGHSVPYSSIYTAVLALVGSQVVPEDADIAVPVEPHLFVPQAQGMADLVDWVAKLKIIVLR